MSPESAPTKRSATRRRVTGCGVWIVVPLVLGTLMINAFVRQMLYPMPTVPVPLAPRPLTEVRLETAAGDTVIGWYGAPAAAKAVGVQILFLHGNGENLATLHMAGFFEELDRLGAAVLAIDYPGYGRSGGRPSQQANVSAAVAGCEWLAARGPDAPTVVMGWSLGAAVAAQVARRCSAQLDAVVLASAWHDLMLVARDHFPALLVRIAFSGFGAADTYDSAEALRDIDLPILMIHGAHDGLIATRHGRSLRGALEGAGRDVTWVEVVGAGHNDLMGRREVWRTVAAFIGRPNKPAG